jgi:cation diffusion facilitator family transporter
MTRTPTLAATQARYAGIRQVLWLVLLLNLTVAAAKFSYGLATNSVAMQADGIHSLFDGISNVVGLVGMWIAARPADENHPYGHGKFETFTAAVIAIMLVIAAYTVGKGALNELLGSGEPTTVQTGSFLVMIGTLAVNLFVTTWESRAGRRLGSEVLVADARHTLSDVAVSSGVIVSLVLVGLGWQQADAIVALLVTLVIIRTALGVIRGVARTLGDEARLPAVELAAVVRAMPGVVDCHSVRTRGLEQQVYLDLHVLIAPGTPIEEGHAIAHRVESELRERYAQIVDVIVHVEPAAG